MIFTHNSTVGKISKILSSNEDYSLLFDGIFVSEGLESDYMGEYSTHFEIDDSLVAQENDKSLDYEKTMSFLKTTYHTLNSEELEILYNLTANDEDIRDYINGDCSHIPFLPEKYKKIYDSKEEALFHIDGIILGDISWSCQNIRGMIAANQGFSAIAMNDEFGISYFIPYTAKYKIVEID